tara:strand:- start:2616 stop:2948 length:333 start_codon:yes stop_codon:yes gene_type:complete
MKKTLITFFFLIQIGLIFYQLNKDTKFFNWAMYHTKISYSVDVTINGVKLNEKEIFERYKINKQGSEYRALEHLKRKMTQREKVYRDSSKVVIELSYIENTHKGTWNWKN